mmetsp:Transcript_4877/g.5429  ORF Transcript_4877/g.5429 Transcript_4877/m.5429 type:complete len:195 (+) Transcript_4877:105-689(+)|eukprot:CAMPEP_0170935596 /NCGR_PEP_ID=MMETSP0735-20130129/19193_1 /TAXON_ID=186038 /ORGANISM="Fragilariopsis kerguelensis, Strain L26-C5" /LENGTH=194 /DNA_ID=CAMNT_0011339337 /DNA_START=89 /DNA_END=673 /DNA_ORIENTATION=-
MKLSVLVALCICIVSSTVDTASAFLAERIAVSPRTTNTNTNVHLHMKKTTVTTSRRDVFSDVVVVASSIMAFGGGGGVVQSLSLSPSAAFALDTIPKDNEIIKEQRTVTNKLDINNAAVADYMQFPGMYPTIGGKIANNGPYNSVRDVYKSSNTLFSKEEISMIKKYAKSLTATKSTGLDTMRGRDPNRRAFNK